MPCIMRLLASCLALLMLLPAASARELPLWYDVDTTLPDDDCGDCASLSVGAGAFIPNCFDCPAAGARINAEHDANGTRASAIACYGSFFVICPVDEHIRL